MKLRLVFVLFLFFLIWIRAFNQEPFLYEPNTLASIAWDKEFCGDGSIVKEIRPYDYQLYPRNSQNTAFVTFSGIVTGSTKLWIKVLKTDFHENTSIYSVNPVTLNFGKFIKSLPIVSELSEYSFFYSFNNSTWFPIAQQVECGDVFLISGQSNAITADLDTLEIDSLVKTYGYQTDYGRFSRTYGDIWKHRGPWHVSSVTGNFEPVSFTVGAWGLALQYTISKQFGIPTCFINGAVGGSSIERHMPPENGPFFFQDSMINSNHYFRHLNTRVYEAGVENDIKGIFWWQGDGGLDGLSPGMYLNRFSGLYEYWQEYFPDFKHTYIIQIPSFSLPNPPLAFTSEDQRMMPAVFQNCRVMAANSIGPHRTEPNRTMHFHSSSYVELARRLTNMLGADIYGFWTPGFEALNIKHAYKHNDTITLQFNQQISGSESDALASVITALKFDKDSIEITSPRIDGKYFEFVVSDTSITKISYLGVLPGNNPDIKCYLKNSNSIACLTFHDFPISSSPLDIEMASIKNQIEIYPNPADSYFTIRNPFNRSESVPIKIYSSSQNLMLSKEVLQNEVVDCRHFANGMYFIQILNQKNPLNSSIIKLIVNHPT